MKNYNIEQPFFLSLQGYFINVPVNLTLLYIIFKNRAGVPYQDLKHEAIADCFIPDKARTTSFLNVL